MHSGRFRRSVVAVVALIVLAVTPTAHANHFYTYYGWRDKHVYYPPVPSGYSGITNVFGPPCNYRANDNMTYWTAQDDHKAYPVYYHYKLGGYGDFYDGSGSTTRSSNFNNDVRGHIRNEHYAPYITHGIYGYLCRKIRSSSKWSTHSWGIAVDINSAANPYPTYSCHGIPGGVFTIFSNHGWLNGKSFGDCMHFQYARNY